MQTETVSKKNRPGKKYTKESNFSTKKSTYDARLETLRRKSIRSEKYRTQ